MSNTPTKTFIKLMIKGGNATPAPPVGTALGSKGINTRDFCLQFNALTQKQKGKLLRVLVEAFADKSFKIHIQGTPTAILIKEALQIEKGSSEPNRKKVGTLTSEMLDYIIEESGDNLWGRTREAKMKTIQGIARSMGVNVTL